jgi:mRNA-degrading endonuclease toxin of MazEF toxin-antitoxin module
MAIKQREVYLLPHPISQNAEEKHPFIVLSSEDSNSHERTFVTVMITSSELTRDDYSFELDDSMFDYPLRKTGSHARMHLIALS